MRFYVNRARNLLTIAESGSIFLMNNRSNNLNQAKLSKLKKLTKDIDIAKMSKKITKKNCHKIADTTPIGKEQW